MHLLAIFLQYLLGRLSNSPQKQPARRTRTLLRSVACRTAGLRIVARPTGCSGDRLTSETRGDANLPRDLSGRSRRRACVAPQRHCAWRRHFGRRAAYSLGKLHPPPRLRPSCSRPRCATKRSCAPFGRYLHEGHIASKRCCGATLRAAFALDRSLNRRPRQRSECFG